MLRSHLSRPRPSHAYFSMKFSIHFLFWYSNIVHSVDKSADFSLLNLTYFGLINLQVKYADMISIH
jgi:hypothetical protein